MKFQSKKPRPETGADLAVTLSLPANLTVEQVGDAVLKFLEGVTRLSNEIGAAWIKVHAEIPDEFQPQLQAAFDKMHNPAGLKVVAGTDRQPQDHP